MFDRDQAISMTESPSWCQMLALLHTDVGEKSATNYAANMSQCVCAQVEQRQLREGAAAMAAELVSLRQHVASLSQPVPNGIAPSRPSSGQPGRPSPIQSAPPSQAHHPPSLSQVRHTDGHPRNHVLMKISSPALPIPPASLPPCPLSADCHPSV